MSPGGRRDFQHLSRPALGPTQPPIQGLFPTVKAAGGCCWKPTPPSSAEAKERVQLYLYSTSGHAWPVLAGTSSFICTEVLPQENLPMLQGVHKKFLNFLGRIQPPSSGCPSILRMEIACSYKTLVSTYTTKFHYTQRRQSEQLIWFLFYLLC